MIHTKGYGRWFGGSSFADAIGYIRREEDDGYALAEWSNGVASIESAPEEMTAIWSMTRAEDPVDHRVISWSAFEVPSIEEAREALEKMYARIGFGPNTQYVATMHNDGKSGMVHLHAVASTIDPVTLKQYNLYNDFENARESMRELERAQGWRELPDDARTLENSTVRLSASEDRYGARKIWKEYIRSVAPVIRAAYEKTDATIESFRATLGTLDIPVKLELVNDATIAVGVRLSSYISGLTASISEAGIKAREFLDRFREQIEHDRALANEAAEGIRVRAERVSGQVSSLQPGDGWYSVHKLFEAENLSYDTWLKKAARIVDNDSGKSIKSTEVEGLSRASLEKKFGAYEGSAQGAAREAERILLQARQEHEVARSLARLPQPLLDSLFDKNATISRIELDSDLERRFVSEASREMVREAVMDRLIGVAMPRDGYEEVRFTTEQYLAEGRRVKDAARELLHESLPIAITREYVGPKIAADASAEQRQIGAELNAQSREAYQHAVQREGRLKLITGVPGAGKTTLINEIASAYRDAGYEVRSVSVVTQAVKILREETDVPARTLASELARYSHGRGLPSRNTLIIVDEISTVGSAQGAELLKVARERGATVIGLGDDKQCPSVARGNTLALLREAYTESGKEVPDLEKTARQKIPWMREATHDVRAGRVREALEAYRDHGALTEAPTRDAAKVALVARWKEYLEIGRTIPIAVLTNEDRRDVNLLCRAAYRDTGKLSGPNVMLNTLDGRVEYAVGDLVRARKAIVDAHGNKRLANGSEAVVARIEDATLILREADGTLTPWDTRQFPEIEHGYANTVNREQGRTGWGEFQLLNGSVRNQTLTVGMTRHQYMYEAFFAREDFKHGFEDVVRRAERFDVKENALDGRVLGTARESLKMVRDLALEKEIEREIERLNLTDELVSGLGL